MLTSKEWDIVTRTTLFASLGPEDLEKLFDKSPVLALRRNQQLFSEGDPANLLFLVLDGQVKLSRLAPEGAEAVVHVFGPGETFAEAAMFMGGRYPVTATAVTAARLVGVSNERLKALVLVKPEIAFAMLASMARHLKVLVAQIEQMKLLTTRQRAIRFLLDHCGRTGGAATFALPHDKALIANRLGMKAETFSRALASLSDYGVAVVGGKVSIEDVNRLVLLLDD